jgi:hypothetical protein
MKELGQTTFTRAKNRFLRALNKGIAEEDIKKNAIDDEEI